MGRPAIFFDRDNTLIACDGYLGDPGAVRLIGGVADAIARARGMGFAIVTFSNQSGVARGMFSEDAVEAVNARMDQLLRQENPGAIVDRHEFCPFHPEAVVERYRQESELRKPRPGMILRAAEALDLDLAESWVIGDAGRDIEAGDAAGCHTILVNDPKLSPSSAALRRCAVDPDETVSSVAEGVDVIGAATDGNPNPSPRRTKAMPEATRSEPTSRPNSADSSRLEHLAHQILDHLKRRHEHPMDFSLGKLLAGVAQVLAIAAAVGSYFYRPAGEPTMPILVAIFLQLLTISLLSMGRDR